MFEVLLDLARDLRFFRPFKLGSRKPTKVPGLQHPTRIHRDLYGVPHIVARNEQDAHIALGYVMARDRLWQMDFFRRAFSGRLAEWLGPRRVNWRETSAMMRDKTVVDLDYFMRIVGLSRAARLGLQKSSEGAQQILEWFCQGVNHYIDSLNRATQPLEYTVLGVSPEIWRPLDTALVGRGMAFQQEQAWRVVLALTALLEKNPDAESILTSLWPTSDGTSITSYRAADTETGSDDLASLSALQGEFVGFGSGPVGSNAWVVGPKASKNNATYLCNDMHLPLTAPSLLYQFHLRCPEVDVIGATFPGLPVALCGHNRDIAWGFTSGKCHASDLVKLAPDPADPERFLGASGSIGTEKRVESIIVRGRGVTTRIVRNTVFGPLISDVLEQQNQHALALSWAGIEPADDIDAFLELNRATDWASFNRAARRIAVPTLGAVYADTKGNIGYHLAGEIPKRTEPPSKFPISAERAEREWKERLSYDDLPALFNPARGFVATANNRHDDDRYPYQLGDFFDPSYRWQRICDVLSRGNLDLNNHKALQTDVKSQHAEQTISFWLRPLSGTRLPRGARKLLPIILEWDCRYDVDSIGATAYRVFYQQWMEQELERLCPNGGAEHLFETLRLVYLPLPLARPFPERRDDSADKRLIEALQRAARYLSDQLGRRSRNWTWGKLHQLYHRHGFHSAPGLRRIFSIGPFPSAGESLTLNNGSFNFGQPFEQNHGAAVRMIVNLTNFHDSYWVLNSGNSGHLMSKNYADQAPLWMKGRYLRMHYSEAAVTTLPCLTLFPAKPQVG